MTVYSQALGTPGFVTMVGGDRPTEAVGVGETGTYAQATDDASTTAGQMYYHFAADAEL